MCLAENCRELLRILLIKPDCLEEIFTAEDGRLNVPADSRVCIALLETKLAKGKLKVYFFHYTFLRSQKH
jgi:hypothetical protein